MSLHLIVGPMFAGKTSAIQSVVRRYTSIGKTTLVLTADIDTRYQESADAVVSHDRSSVSATAIHVDHLAGVLVTDAFKEAFAIVVDEAQFFSGLYEFVKACVDSGKHVVVVGLDGDGLGKPFTHVLELVAIADSVEKKTALCGLCGDGTPAIFTKALQKQDRIAVGGADMYEPTCRKHF